MKIQNLCIIAGSGNLPLYALTEALKRNQEKKMQIYVYVLDEDNKELLQSIEENKVAFRKISLGKFDEVLKKLKADKVTHVLFIGKVQKKNILKGIRFNLKTLMLLRKLKDWNDKSIFNLIAEELKKIKIEILKQELFLQSLLCTPGLYSKQKPSKSELTDINYGMEFAKKIAWLDIGQTVIVANKTLLAVEAIEGTDEAIKRACMYAVKNTAVVCKAIRKGQDTRFDVPTVGLHTIETMRQNACRILAVEAGHTFVVNQEQFFKKINEYKMVFMALS
ncbi:MAG: UDP-2,3-diacylglucosamine diphosphatase LpxI [Spirochaetia bacterium]|nr:UDP-2,3-diacylglucosamine diphosphatase LpxI [Spirochaetia bacterium]